MRGVYILIIKLDKDTNICAGRLDKLHFKKGYYAYVGSALGTGGFKRVTRHFNVASGKNRTRKWHIDYLLPHSCVVCAVLLPTDEALECTVAKTLGQFSEEIPGFGCTDCACRTHLFFSGTDLKDSIVRTCSKLIENESIIISPNM